MNTNEILINYNNSRQKIFIITSLVTLVGLTIDSIIFNDGLLLIQYFLKSLTFLLIFLSILYFIVFSKKRYDILFAIVSYGVFINIIIGHIIYNKYLIYSNQLIELLFLRDAIFMFCFIGMSGFLSGKKHVLIQASILFISTVYYAFIVKQDFINSNFFIISICIVGYGALMYFTVKIAEKFAKGLKKSNEIIEQQKNTIINKNKEILDSIQYAKRIQNAILPPIHLLKEYYNESFILYKPKDIIAGDFYWIEEVNDIKLIAVADCTGHGVPGAMLSVVCHNAMNRAVREFKLTEPGEILDKVRALVVQEFEKSDEDVQDGMDIALCAIKGNNLKYAGAHNPLWIVRNNDIIETKANKEPIGKFQFKSSFNTHSFELKKEDCIYLFSDGIVDQFGGDKKKKFKPANLRKLLLSIQNQELSKQKLTINQVFENWKGELEQVDDVCMIGLKIK